MIETAIPREGEELDLPLLHEYLTKVLGLSGELRISQFPAGSSNLTYSIGYGRDEFVLRRPPFGNRVTTAHDMRRRK